MADKKISQLTTLVQADVATTADFVPIVDTSAVETKKVTPQALVQAGATGATLALADGSAAAPALTNTGDENTGIFFPAADTIAFAEGGVESMRLDSSGNLGIGVTPSAWSTAASRKAIQLGYTGGAAVFTNATGNTLSSFVHNAYDNGTNWLYAASSVGAARYEMTGANAGSTHAWYVSAGGTAGNAISFTQAMTLDASGNLGIGTASPQYRLDLQSSAALGLRLKGGSAANQGSALLGTYAGSSSTLYAFGDRASLFGGTPDQLVSIFTGGPALTFDVNGGEKARIDANGNIVAGASAALATTATNGFLYVPTCAGTPTGTPTAITGMAPIVVNTTNNKLYFYSGGAWRDAGP